MDNFILNTTYFTENKVNVIDIGLNQINDYTPSVRLAKNTSFNSSNGVAEYDIPEAVVLNEMDWYRLIGFSEKINSFFSYTAPSPPPLNSMLSENKYDFEEIDIGSYLLEFDQQQQVIIFKFKVYSSFSLYIPCLDINFSFWNEILRLHTCISYKFKLIDNYKFYAKIVHSKIVNYFLIQISKKEVEKDALSLLILKNILISLKSNILPKSPIECNYDLFNKDICLNIDAEIRAHSPPIIFRDIGNALTKFSQSSYNNNTNQWWWN